MSPRAEDEGAAAHKLDRQGEIDEQTRIRRALLAGGYTPLANKDKMCILLGWSSLVVDAALIDSWQDAWKYRGTGVRLDNGLCMIDMDINDEVMVAAICDTMPDDLWELFGTAPRRFGRGAKEAWFVRVDRPFVRWASAAYFKAGDDDDAPLQRLECFANSGRQAGAFGAHTIGADNSVEVPYRWADDVSLLDIPLGELPQVTVEHVERLCDHVTATMAKAGWRRKMNLRTGETTEAEVFDLHDEMVFDTVEGEMSLAELIDAVQVSTLRLSASWLEGPNAKNLSRCIASARHDGKLQILETAGHQLHRLVEDEPGASYKLGSKALERLAQMRADFGLGAGMFTNARGIERDNGGAPENPPLSPEAELAQIVDILVETLVFIPSADRCICEIGKGPDRAMTLGNARHLLSPLSVEFKGQRGAVKLVNPFDAWLLDSRRVVVVGFRFDPSTEALLIPVGEEKALNLYEPVRHGGAERWGLEDFHVFMAHLVPDVVEREWFFDWLAGRVQQPWSPSCGVLMVAHPQGTGRGTLFDLLGDVLGRAHVQPISSTELLGDGGQGQYTEWLEMALLVTCDEVLSAGDDGSNMAWKRRESYERLKQLIDPRSRMMNIICKGRPNYRGMIYANFLLATNNSNALPLIEGDRRIAVLRGAKRALVKDAVAKAAIDRLRKPNNLGGIQEGPAAAIYDWLTARKIDWEALREAPLFQGKIEMVAANEGDLEDMLEDTLLAIPGNFILNGHLHERLEKTLNSQGLRDSIRNWWVRAQDELKRRPERYGWQRMLERQHISSGGKKAVVYVRADAALNDHIALWLHTSIAGRYTLYMGASNLNETTSKLTTQISKVRLRLVKDMVTISE